MRAAFSLAEGQRQDLRRAVDTIDLALFVHGEHDDLLGCRKLPADDFADLLDELQVDQELVGHGS